MGDAELRRRYERKKYKSDILFTVMGRTYSGTLKDISLGGAFVVTLSVNQVSKRDIITIDIPFTDGKRSVKRRGKVVWVTGAGFGVEFI